jgi:hypothetical protein
VKRDINVKETKMGNGKRKWTIMVGEGETKKNLVGGVCE